jgi:hypothetical protein
MDDMIKKHWSKRSSRLYSGAGGGEGVDRVSFFNLSFTITLKNPVNWLNGASLSIKIITRNT